MPSRTCPPLVPSTVTVTASPMLIDSPWFLVRISIPFLRFPIIINGGDDGMQCICFSSGVNRMMRGGDHDDEIFKFIPGRIKIFALSLTDRLSESFQPIDEVLDPGNRLIAYRHD